MTRPALRLVLLGGGSIARTVATAVGEGHLPGVEVIAVVGRSIPPSDRTLAVAKAANARVSALDTALDLGADWVLEAAGAPALKEHLETLVVHPSGLIVMSIGALLDTEAWSLVEKKRSTGGRVVLPSGSIGGLDAVAALNALGDLKDVRITTAKAPAGLAGAPYLTENRVSLSQTERQLVFEGTAREAVKAFPANVNVAAALSLAGIGADRTMVRVVSDPSLVRTQHTIEAEGSSGRLHLDIESSPNPLNPKSSYLSALSAIGVLRELVDEARARPLARPPSR